MPEPTTPTGFVVTEDHIRGLHKSGLSLPAGLQALADRAFAACVASVNVAEQRLVGYQSGRADGYADAKGVDVAEIERAAKYEVLREFRDDATPFTTLLTRYAPPTPPPVWREWARPSDGVRFRTTDGKRWEIFSENVWRDLREQYIPCCGTAADILNLAAFLTTHFPEVTP